MSCTPKSKGLEVVLSARAPRAAATSRKGLQARWFFIGARARRLSESPSAHFPLRKSPSAHFPLRKSSSLLLMFNTTRARARMVPGPPSTGVAIAMDGGMAVSLRQTRARRARFYVHVHVQSTSRQVLLAGHGWSVPCVSIQAFNLKFSCVSIQAFNLKFSCRSGRGPVSPDTPETSKKQTPKFLLTISASFR